PPVANLDLGRGANLDRGRQIGQSDPLVEDRAQIPGGDLALRRTGSDPISVTGYAPLPHHQTGQSSVDPLVPLPLQRRPPREVVIPVHGEVEPRLEWSRGGVDVGSPQSQPRLETKGVTGTQSTWHGAGLQDPVEHFSGLARLQAQLAPR